jgi:hypothetical protein
MIEPGRDPVQHHHETGDEARDLHLPASPHQHDQLVHQELEPGCKTVHLDGTPREIIATVKILHRDFKKLLANNAK